MADLSLNLFGGFTIHRPLASPVAIRSAKSKALLAYLAYQPGQSHSRDKLAALFWENSDRAQARKSLRQALAVLRSAVSDNGGKGDSPHYFQFYLCISIDYFSSLHS